MKKAERRKKAGKGRKGRFGYARTPSRTPGIVKGNKSLRIKSFGLV